MGNKDQYGLAGLIAGVPVAAFQTAQADTPSAPLKPEPWVRLSDVLAALEAAPHVNETPKCAHDDADVLSTPPDLVEKAGKVADRLRAEKSVISTTRTFPSGDERDMVLVPHYGPNPLAHEAADTIRALIALCQAQAAQIAGLEAFIRNDADWKFSAKRRLELFCEQRARAEAAEAEAHACGAERERWKERAEVAEAEAATLRAENERLREVVLQKVAECLAGMTYREVSQEARARIKRALDAALEGKHE